MASKRLQTIKACGDLLVRGTDLKNIVSFVKKRVAKKTEKGNDDVYELTVM